MTLQSGSIGAVIPSRSWKVSSRPTNPVRKNTRKSIILLTRCSNSWSWLWTSRVIA